MECELGVTNVEGIAGLAGHCRLLIGYFLGSHACTWVSGIPCVELGGNLATRINQLDETQVGIELSQNGITCAWHGIELSQAGITDMRSKLEVDRHAHDQVPLIHTP